MERFNEGEVTFFAENRQTRDSKVFFNPIRKFDRDLNVLFINSFSKENLNGIELFGGSGIRGLRLASETKNFKTITINDIKTSKTINKNVKLNGKKLKAKIKVCSMNAQDIYNSEEGYDYVDIDPYGSPVKYMVQALPKTKFGGILAITATDSAALYGKARKACLLKYGSVSFKARYYNEVGLRILIKRAEEIANLSERSIEPVLFDVRKHYLRVYLKVKKGDVTRRIGYIYQCSSCPNRTIAYATKCDSCGSKTFEIGPLWLGNLFDRKLVNAMYPLAEGELKEYLSVLKNEEDIITYYTTDQMSSYLKEREKKLGLIGTKTVLDGKGFRTRLAFKDLVEKYKQL